MSEIKQTICDECGRAPRRLSMTMDGRLFCQRACYLAWCGKIWDQEFTEMFKHKAQQTNVTDFKDARKK